MADPEYIGLLIVAARQAMKRAICDHARAHRLTSQQFWTMVTIRQAPGMSLAGLADTLLVDAPAASRIVQALAARGLVEMGNDPDDRRRIRLRLSDAGEKLGQKLGAISERFQEAIVRGLDAPAQAALKASLRRVVQNMADFLASTEVATRGGDGASPGPLARAAGAPTPVPVRLPDALRRDRRRI